MSASAAWESVTQYLYGYDSNALKPHYFFYNRKPGVYLNSFTLTVGVHAAYDFTSYTGYAGLWRVPYNAVPTLNTSSKLVALGGMAANTERTTTQSVTAGNLIALSCGDGQGTFYGNSNYKYLYGVYPGDGSVTANASGSTFGGAQTVKFSTPTACSWPSPYAGTTNGHNSSVYGLLWPDVLISYSTSGAPADPTYPSNNGIFTYSATGSANGNKTTASLNLAANQTYTVKVRLAVDNSGSRADVEYGKVNTFTYYTYAAPTASPAAGTYTTPQQVTLGGAASGQVIRYTTNGSEPTGSSPVYSAPIPIQGTTAVKAQKYIGSTPVSPVTTYNYTINPPAVTASPGAGTLYNTQEIALSCGDYELYYTLDGSAPTRESGTKYTTPIQLTENIKIRVQRYFEGEAIGAVTDFDYTINIPGVAANPASGAVGKGTEISLAVANGNAVDNDVLYTENDALPYDKWTLYTNPIEISKDTTIYAVARDKISGRYGETSAFAYQYSELGYILNDLSFWQGSTKVTSTDISFLAGQTITAKANITKIIPSVQGWLVTALYDPSGRAVQIKLDKLDQISGNVSGTVSGKTIALPDDTTNYVLKTFIVHDFAQLRPIGAAVQIGGEGEE